MEKKLKSKTRPIGIGWKLYTLPILEETFWSYLAGIIDGEGSINLVPNGRISTQPRIDVVNTNMDLLLFVKNRIGGEIHEKKLGTKSVKPCFVLYFQSHNKVLAILEKTLPYLIIKKEKAIEIINLIKLKIL